MIVSLGIMLFTRERHCYCQCLTWY